MASPHIVTSFDEKLSNLHDLVMRMGKLAIGQVERAIKALETNDASLANAVVSAVPECDELRYRLSDEVVLLLALRAPVADDLRSAIVALRIGVDLQRVSDYARTIAGRVLELGETSTWTAPHSIPQMGWLVHESLVSALDAYDRGDAEAAVAVWQLDSGVNQQYSGTFRELLTYMMEDSRLLPACSHLVLAGRDIERIGDHAASIAELVYYQVTGSSLPGGPSRSVSEAAP